MVHDIAYAYDSLSGHKDTNPLNPTMILYAYIHMKSEYW